MCVDWGGRARSPHTREHAHSPHARPRRRPPPQGYMLVYSITDDTSFAKLDAIHKEVTEKLAGRPVPFFLIGTKKDLSSDRAVSEKERTAKAAKWGCQSFEVSSKTDEGVSEVFERMAQAILAVSGDTSKGRQMPDHYCYRKAKVTSISSPIGTQITQAVGFSWAAKLKKDDLVALTYFGEGGTSSNEFHNGMNFAGVYKTPTVFFCRNNGWAISVPTERQTGSRTFAEKAIAYGMPGIRVDGNDIFAVVKVTRDAIERAARGEGPTLIEAMTYRLSGHSTSDDPKVYRPDNSVDPWRALDPLPRMRRYLEKYLAWTEAQDKQVEADLDAELKAAIKVSEATPAPSIDSMFEDVFGELPWHLAEQRDELKKGERAKPH